VIIEERILQDETGACRKCAIWMFARL